MSQLVSAVSESKKAAAMKPARTGITHNVIQMTLLTP